MSISNTNRMRLFIAAYVAVFIALAGFGYFIMNEKHGASKDIEALASHKIVTDLAYYDLPRITVSVDTAGKGMPPRLRADISLEVARKDVRYLAGYQPRITEKLSALLASLKPEDVVSSAAMPQLRADMLRLINEPGAPIPVHDLLFRELVVM